ncbi:hypothetical protein [Erythrobacter sanguineus]|uniref:Uncharacterized protein n=1 Tax=Erythrobacter sanguineus TaxID=198312 RepID=A0A1M7S8E6_9SPHN|nr:hypothetical protein [Erythrobacter sanguineus]SHN54710.1 hypothetical protein SAMN02745193_01170 [Erythrobacter sanguineus]
MVNCKNILFVALLASSLAGCGGASDSAAPAASDRSTIAENGPPPPPDIPEPIEPGDEYTATTILDCGFDGAAPTQKCNAGVKRNWGDAGDEALVEVFKPDGRKRALYFKGTDPYGADSAEADGSAAWDFTSTREGDEVTITFGPETYVIFDSLIVGG